ncbi:hypothetical protein [Microbulbifer sp. Q7]|uniref:hypothetical protein n=1 Tax=Microbulbifer sp. Q7 TaxID=1785091 RepID=UPI000833915E|nr:hypothetical protein [Microbulbifer sp. Q7]
MRYFGCGALSVVVTMWSLSLSGCGYLPSEMDAGAKTSKSPEPGAAAGVVVHTANCETRAKGFKLLNFDDLYTVTGDPREPFRPAQNLPDTYDVQAYLWGYDNCLQKGNCQHGDHYWMIKRGPEDDFSTWVVTPQFPRITIESRCKDQLKIGKRYRLSIKNGKLVGLSRN